jgi:hypothetical protein
MTELTEKRRILDGAGFIYEFYHEVYVNRKEKKVISVDFIEDHTAAELKLRVQEETDGTAWHFLFNNEPAASVRHQLETALG